MEETPPAREPDDLESFRIEYFPNPLRQLLEPEDPEAIERFCLENLITQGYQFAEEAGNEQVRKEYEHANHVFLAIDKQSGKAIASLAYSDMGEESLAGRAFFQQLEMINAQLAEALKGKKLLHVEGVVVDPSERNKGLAQKLLKEATTKLVPDIIFGETKTPEAVASRADQVGGQGYEVFYGNYEVTKGKDVVSTDVHHPILQGYNSTMPLTLGTHLGSREDYFTDALFVVSTDLLKPDVPVLAGRLERLRPSFEKLIEKQRRLGDTGTVVAPLVTIRSDLLRK